MIEERFKHLIRLNLFSYLIYKPFYIIVEKNGVNSVRPAFQIFFFSFFLFLIPSLTFANESTEWIVYFTNPQSAQDFSSTHSYDVLDIYDNYVKVENISKEALLKNPYVVKVEHNYKKEPAVDSLNDPLYPSQWYLNPIHFSQVMKTYPHPGSNLLSNQEMEIDGQISTYQSQKLMLSSNKVITFHNIEQVMNRISLTIDIPSNQSWKVVIRDEDGELIGENSGSTKQLDVLIPRKKYSSLQIMVEADGFEQSLSVEEMVGVNHSIVAILDSGVSYHEDFCGNVLYSLGENYHEKNAPPLDKYGHGTHVAGIIAACHNNHIGISGVTGNAPVDIIPFKVLNDIGLGGDFEISQGVEDAIQLNVDVINLSLAGKGKTTMLDQSLQKAFKHNIPVVVAAGNWNTFTDGIYPASYPSVITVAALNQQLEKHSTSNYGQAVDIAAPGEKVLSTYLNNTYKSLSGTSMATPIVSSAISLLRLQHPGQSLVELRGDLFQSVQDLYTKGHDQLSGYGMIDFNKILNQDTFPVVSKIEWLDLHDHSSLEDKMGTLAIAPSLIGKELLILEDEKPLIKKTIDQSLEEIKLNESPSFSKTKIVTIIKGGNSIYSIHHLYLDNPDISRSTFSDVNHEYWAHDEISHAAENGFINGYTDGTFKPQKNISRRHATMMMNRLFRWDSLQDLSSPFNDLHLSETPGYDSLSILSAYHAGAIKGYPNGEFNPNGQLTRGQMALILARALQVDQKTTSTSDHQFDDLNQRTLCTCK